MLSQSGMAAGDIAAHFRVSRPAVSQHLRILRRAKLVAVQKRGREHIYHLNPTPLVEVYDWIEHYKSFWTTKMTSLGNYLDRLSKPQGTRRP
jgi:DNA-binding transcriptional ArsR family regulator